MPPVVVLMKSVVTDLNSISRSHCNGQWRVRERVVALDSDDCMGVFLQSYVPGEAALARSFQLSSAFGSSLVAIGHSGITTYDDDRCMSQHIEEL